MKKQSTLLIFILLSLISFKINASHIAGCDISYQCTTTPNVYKVNVKIYRDCSGIPLCPGCSSFPGNISTCNTSNAGLSTSILGASGTCLGNNFGSFTLNIVPDVSGYDVIQTCATSTTICTNCNTRTAGTMSTGIEVYIFEGNVNLSSIPTSCCRVTLGVNGSTRNAALTTMIPGTFQAICELDRCQSICNSAPTFTNDAVLFLCAGVDFIHNLGASDPDGDSLSYAFGQSYQSIGSPVSYVPPYSANYPFSYLGAPNPNASLPAGLHINQATGDIRFRPQGVFVSQLVIEVTQWKLVGNTRVNVGMTRRDIQIQSFICSGSSPNLAPLVKIYNNGIIQSGLNFSVFEGSQICLDFVAQDQSSGSITADTTDLKWNNPATYIPVMANATFTRNYVLSQRGLNGPKADSFKFCWTPPIGSIRTTPYLFTVSGSDRFCPYKAVNTLGINISVIKPKSLTIDSTTKKIYCNHKIINSNVNYRTSSINLITGNVLTVQLSDSSGSFTNSTIIGSKTTTDTVSVIPIIIPANLYTNTNYKIRVNSSSDTVNLGTPFAISFVAGFSTPVITNNRDSFCKGLVSTFKVTPNTSGLTYKWLKNNLVIANETKDSLIVDSAYTYRALVSNNGCTDTSNAMYLTVYPKPIVGFTTNNSSQCINFNNFIFTDTSKVVSGNITRIWTLNNSDTSSNIIVNKTFSTIGTLPIKLIAISNNNCRDSITKNIVINPKPTVGFTINNSAQCLNGNSFKFTDTSRIATGVLAIKKWNFGTSINDTSIISSPTKTYNSPNTYFVKLVVNSSLGCKDSLTKTIIVHPKPLVNFTINSQTQCFKNNNFIFTDSTNILSGTISRKWNLGTGLADTTNQLNPTKTYSSPNSYTITLIATSNNNCKDSALKNILVNNSPTANFTINKPQQCLKGNGFNFNNISTGLNNQSWSFGDTSNSNIFNPQKTYLRAGTYNVMLVANNVSNCTDTITKTITVYPQPNIAISVNKSSQCLNGNNFIFNDISSISSGTINRLWLFDNGDTSTNSITSKTYSSTGNYTIKLIIKSNNNCIDTANNNITVLPKLTIGNILGNSAPTSVTIPFQYSVLSQANSNYNWTALNGTIQSGQGTNAVNVIWPTAGIGNLKAEITNNDGCKDSTNLSINITSVGINKLSLENDLNVYPNPTKNNITITNKTNLVGKNYIIENLIGQTILSGKLNLDETIVNLETLQSGMYFLSIDGLNKQSIKVIKE